LHHPLNEETKVYKKKTPSGWESTYLPYLSGWRDLNSRPHGPEPVSEILNCSPHGLVFFSTMWTTFLGNHVDYDELKTVLYWVEN